MQRVHLMGELSQFGPLWETECTSLGDIARLIDCQEPRWRPWIIKNHEEGMQVKIVKGSEIVVDPNELLIRNNVLKDEDIYITPVPAGSGKGGKFLALGLILMMPALQAGFANVMASATAGGTQAFSLAGMGISGAANAFMGGITMAGGLGVGGLIGLNLVLGGLSMLLSQGPETEYDPNKDETPADKVFNGPINVTKQNIPIPILYGELIVGGVVISGNYKLMEEVATKSTTNYGTQDVTFDLFGPLTGNDKLSKITGGYLQS